MSNHQFSGSVLDLGISSRSVPFIEALESWGFRAEAAFLSLPTRRIAPKGWSTPPYFSQYELLLRIQPSVPRRWLELLSYVGW
jgi:hypothetical protein